jgi:hypothetical protein
MLRTPSTRLAFACEAIPIYLVWPFLDMRYYMRMLELGKYPPNADTIAIPMAESFMLATYLAPGFLALLFAVLWKYKPGVPLFIWNRERRTATWIWTIIAAFFIWSSLGVAFDDLKIGLYLNVLYTGLVVYFWLVVRAVFAGTPKPPSKI